MEKRGIDIHHRSHVNTVARRAYQVPALLDSHSRDSTLSSISLPRPAHDSVSAPLNASQGKENTCVMRLDNTCDTMQALRVVIVPYRDFVSVPCLVVAGSSRVREGESFEQPLNFIFR
jgi:hypothetical protein